MQQNITPSIRDASAQTQQQEKPTYYRVELCVWAAHTPNPHLHSLTPRLFRRQREWWSDIVASGWNYNHSTPSLFSFSFASPFQERPPLTSLAATVYHSHTDSAAGWRCIICRADTLSNTHTRQSRRDLRYDRIFRVSLLQHLLIISSLKLYITTSNFGCFVWIYCHKSTQSNA